MDFLCKMLPFSYCRVNNRKVFFFFSCGIGCFLFKILPFPICFSFDLVCLCFWKLVPIRRVMFIHLFLPLFSNVDWCDYKKKVVGASCIHVKVKVDVRVLRV